MSETMELAVVNAQNAVQIFTGGGLESILTGIEMKVRAMQFDISTKDGRDEIRSVAYQVAKTKVALDKEGKGLTEAWRESTKKVNAERAKATERLDALAEEVRKPLTDFENKEKLRVRAHEEALSDITGMHAMISAYPDMTVDLLREHLSDLMTSNHGRDWEEFSERAKAARDEARNYILTRIEARTQADADRAELERLRKQEAERIQRERDERLKAEAAESARLAAEQKARDEAERVRIANERLKAEAEERRQAEKNARLAAEKRAKDAEDARIAAQKKAAADLLAAQEKAKRDAAEAVEQERERVERERKAAEAERLKREADQQLKDRIHREIANDCAEKSANEIATAIMEGHVRHVRVAY